MRGGAPEMIPPFLLGGVGIRSRIDQVLHPADRQGKSEGIRMPMSCDASVANRPRIGDQADFTVALKVATEDIVAARRKCLPRRKPRLCRAFLLKPGVGLAPQ